MNETRPEFQQLPSKTKTFGGMLESVGKPSAPAVVRNVEILGLASQKATIISIAIYISNISAQLNPHEFRNSYLHYITDYIKALYVTFTSILTHSI